MKHPLYGILLAGFGAMVLTPDTLFMRLSGMDGFQMMAWRGLLMGGVLWVVCLLREGARAKARLPMMADRITVLAILCHSSNAALFTLGVAIAPVSVVLLGVAAGPVFSAILSRVILGEPASRATWVTMAAVIAGVALAVTGNDAKGMGPDVHTILGALAGLGVGATLALTFVLMRRNRDIPILPTIGSGAFLAGLAGFALTGPDRMMDGTVWAIALTGAVILPTTFVALNVASRHTHAANVSLLMLLETVLGPLWVWWGVNEALTPPMLLGGLLVVGSLAAYIHHERRR